MSCVEDGGLTFKQHWVNVMCQRWWVNIQTALVECHVWKTMVQHSNSIGWMSCVEDGDSTFKQHWVNVMCRRRWFNIGAALGECHVSKTLGTDWNSIWLNVMCRRRCFNIQTALGECNVSKTVVQHRSSIGWMSCVEDGDSTLEQHWVNVPRLLGLHPNCITEITVHLVIFAYLNFHYFFIFWIFNEV